MWGYIVFEDGLDKVHVNNEWGLERLHWSRKVVVRIFLLSNKDYENLSFWYCKSMHKQAGLELAVNKSVTSADSVRGNTTSDIGTQSSTPIRQRLNAALDMCCSSSEKFSASPHKSCEHYLII